MRRGLPLNFPVHEPTNRITSSSHTRCHWTITATEQTPLTPIQSSWQVWRGCCSNPWPSVAERRPGDLLGEIINMCVAFYFFFVGPDTPTTAARPLHTILLSSSSHLHLVVRKACQQQEANTADDAHWFELGLNNNKTISQHPMNYQRLRKISHSSSSSSSSPSTRTYHLVSIHNWLCTPVGREMCMKIHDGNNSLQVN